MTLAEARRIGQGIGDVLASAKASAIENKLAREYAEACRLASHRLQQCAAMIQAGQPMQALQLAEAPPPLLDLVTALSFKDAPRWREYCAGKGLPVAEKFDPAAVRRVNEAYAQGIDANHPLYRDYRQAVMRHDDHKALSVLRIIVKLNPADANAGQELERVQRKVARAQWKRLETAVDAGEESAVLEELDALEQLGIAPTEEFGLWQRAQALRCECWLRQVRPLRADGNWKEAEPWIKRIDSARSEHEIPLPGLLADELVEARDWVEGEAQAELEEQQFRKTYADFRHLLDLCEDKQVSTRRRDLADLRGDLEGLGKKWQELQRFDRGLEEDDELRFEKYYRLLRTQVTQREKTNRFIYVSLAIVILIAGAMVGKRVLDHRRAGSLAAELNQLREQREVLAAEGFVTQIRTNDAALLRVPVLGAAVDSADQFIGQEKQLRDVADNTVAALQLEARSGFQALSPERYREQLDEAVALKNGLAEDFQSGVQEKLLAFQNRWEAFLFETRQQRSRRFDELLTEIEQAASQVLRYESGVDPVAEGLEDLSGRLPPLENLARPELEELTVQQELLLRYRALTDRIAAVRRQVEQWRVVENERAAPSGLEGFIDALRLMQDNPFAKVEHMRQARVLASLEPSADKLVSTLIAGDRAELVRALQENQPFKTKPDDILPAERTRLAALQDDVNIHGLVRYRMTEKGREEGDPLRVREVFARNPLQRNKFGRMEGDVFDPALTPETLRFEARQFASGEYEIEELGPTGEARVFERVGLKQLVDGNTGQYTQGLLRVIDLLNAEDEASPVFRAWLVLRLLEVIDLQPASWGAQWAGWLPDYRRGLAANGTANIRSGDWLLPGRRDEWSEPLKEFLAGYEERSFDKQARYFHELARRAARDGFAFAGYVHPDSGAAVGVRETAMFHRDLWGWTIEGKVPGRLFQYDSDKGGYAAVREGLPFSPLFVFRSNRERMPTVVADSVGFSLPKDAEWRAFLPRLFQP